ncbi:MAG: DAK2 domain-containing protein [Thermoleophilia bacterium]
MGSSAEALIVSRARALVAASYEALEERRQEINDLNVYPVPDGDTGTNLSLTLRGILDSFDKLPPTSAQSELCAAISQAALMGARGNSGVILSQIVRGAMEVLGTAGPLTTEALVRALRHSTDSAYRAVRRPVEGTILTVLRDMAAHAEEVAKDGAVTPDVLMEAVVAEGWRSVERTPSLLRVLADAGVVDAGGYGLVVLLEGATRGGRNEADPIATHIIERPPAWNRELEIEEAGETDSFAYCTSYLLTGEMLDKTILEQQLSGLGDCLLVVGDGTQVKVHIHTDKPGEVLSIGTSVGVLSRIVIDNIAEQTVSRAHRLAQSDVLPADPGLTQVVAVVSGEGNKRLFRNLHVDFVVDGGQSMNPSAEDLMRAIDKATAPSIIILPNNGNIIMAAEQTARLSDKHVLVVPSRSLQAGLAAAVAYERQNEGSVNEDDMRAAMSAAVTADITRAVRDSLVDDVQVKAQDFIGLIDDRLVIAAADLGPVIEHVLAHLLDGDREVLTVLVGEGEDGARALDIVQKLCASYPMLEVDIHEGGQPFYPLLLSAE